MIGSALNAESGSVNLGGDKMIRMSKIQKAAVAQGMHTLREDGWHKVLCGRTTIEEVARATKGGDRR